MGGAADCGDGAFARMSRTAEYLQGEKVCLLRLRGAELTLMRYRGLK